MDVPVKNQSGDTVETISLSNAVFGVPMNPSLVHQALVIYQGNKRQGTHDTKTRAEVSGGGRKPWIQKHTGRARQGSTRSPQWRHGGIAFGPHPRSYRKALPRRMRRQAVKCVLSEKARSGALVCVDNLDTIDGKTRSMVNLLNNLGVSGSVLLVTPEADQSVAQAAHNLKGLWTLPVNLLNANDLLSRQTLIMTVAAARQAEDIWTALPNRGIRRLASAAGAADTGEEFSSEVEDDSVSDGEGQQPAPAPRRRRSTAASQEGEAES